MAINPDAVGTTGTPVESSWTSKDSLLYAVGIGAGTTDLAFTTENSMNIAQRAYPTQAVVLGDASGAFANIGTFNPAMLVHGEQAITLHRELPVQGSVVTTGEVTAVWDKGKGAVVEVTSRSMRRMVSPCLTRSCRCSSVARAASAVSVGPRGPAACRTRGRPPILR